MSNTTATFTRPSPTNPTNSTNNFSGPSWEQLNNEYSWFIDPNLTAYRLEEIAIAIYDFLWTELKVFRSETSINVPSFSGLSTQTNVFCIKKTRFSGGCFKLPHSNPNPFVCPDIVAHEYTHGLFEPRNPLRDQLMGRCIEEMICDIVGVIFNQFYSRNPDDWSIGGLRDLSKENFDDGTLKHAKFFKIPIGPSLKNNDIESYNSQILSRVFFLASSGVRHNPTKKKILLKIWLNSVMTLKDNEKTYVGLRDKTKKLASEEEKSIHNAVSRAWHQISY